MLMAAIRGGEDVTSDMAGWMELRGPTRTSQPRRLAMPDPAVAPLALALAAQRTEWLDVVVPAGVETGKKFSSEYCPGAPRLPSARRRGLSGD